MYLQHLSDDEKRVFFAIILQSAFCKNKKEIEFSDEEIDELNEACELLKDQLDNGIFKYFNLYKLKYNPAYKKLLSQELIDKILEHTEYEKNMQIASYFVELGFFSEEDLLERQFCLNMTLDGATFYNAFGDEVINSDYQKLFGLKVDGCSYKVELDGFESLKNAEFFFEQFYSQAYVYETLEQDVFDKKYLKLIKNKKLFYFELRNYYENIPYKCEFLPEILALLESELNKNHMKTICNELANRKKAKEELKNLQNGLKHGLLSGMFSLVNGFNDCLEELLDKGYFVAHNKNTTIDDLQNYFDEKIKFLLNNLDFFELVCNILLRDAKDELETLVHSGFNYEQNKSDFLAKLSDETRQICEEKFTNLDEYCEFYKTYFVEQNYNILQAMFESLKDYSQSEKLLIQMVLLLKTMKKQ